MAARSQGSHGRPSARTLLLNPCSVAEDVLHLRGVPDDVVGLATVQRREEPDESAFELATTNIAETRFGYLQRLTFAPMVSTNLPASAFSTTRTLSFARLPPPGLEAQVPVRTALDPQTAPGTYEATFDIAGHEQRAQIEVLPVERLSISPGSISINAAPGEAVPVELIITNSGNVPLELDTLGMLVLQEEEQVCLSLQRALGAVKKKREGQSYEVFLNALADSLAERKTDFGKVRLANGAVTLNAGDSWCGPVAIHTPRDMMAGRQYRALLKARTAHLFVKISCRVGRDEGDRETMPA